MIRRRTRTSRRGASAIEFALTTPVLAGMVVGVLDFGWFFVQQSAVVTVVRDGVRMGVTAEDGDATVATSTAQSFIESELASRSVACSDATGCTIDVEVDTTGAYDVLTATVTAEFQPLAGMPGIPLPASISSSFTMLMEEQS